MTHSNNNTNHDSVDTDFLNRVFSDDLEPTASLPDIDHDHSDSAPSTALLSRLYKITDSETTDHTIKTVKQHSQPAQHKTRFTSTIAQAIHRHGKTAIPLAASLLLAGVLIMQQHINQQRHTAEQAMAQMALAFSYLEQANHTASQSVTETLRDNLKKSTLDPLLNVTLTRDSSS
ncbi:hypothetical protein [Teredinibacter waterburyi]|jgi:hypothetical protein|uniref:hypothetical protein n=1 Tax=Teredinibacter waterburyi TaxID=1500538 RepID=UPI00165F8395|nr:hypothetical protein [Teredinibacter waterburyi]